MFWLSNSQISAVGRFSTPLLVTDSLVMEWKGTLNFKQAGDMDAGGPQATQLEKNN